MTDREKREDQYLKKCIQEAYGCTDEQLMDELSEIEDSLSDSEFSGVEDRIMTKLMQRIAEEDAEKAEDKTAEPELKKCEPENVSHYPETSEVKEKKFVRIGRKKILMVAALAAVFAGTLGVTAIGGKSYFFREREKKTSIVYNSGKNKLDVDNFGNAYEEIRKKFGDEIFTLGYLPEEIEFVSLTFDEYKAIIKLKYKENYVYFIQWKSSNEETSITMNFDPQKSQSVKNKWVGQDIAYTITQLDENQYEIESQIEKSDMVAWIFGKIEKDIFEEILKNIYFSQ